MNTKNTADIDELIKEIEHYRVNINDPCLGSGFWDEAVKDFIARHSGKLVSLLDELGKSRNKTLVNLPADHIHRVIVDGRADGKPANALSDALNKAILYYSYQHDIIIILQNIMKLPEGGYRATLEVHALPLTSQRNLQSGKEDENWKHIHDHSYGKKHKEQLVKYPVFNHFSGTDDDGQTDLPDYMLVNVSDPAIMNYMIEQKFFDAGRFSWPAPVAGTEPPKQMMVRIRRPRIELTS